MELTRENYIISTDKRRLNQVYIHDYLSRSSYWAEGVPADIVARSIEGSLCFGVYDGGRQIGFARMITDKATFAYLADVFIDEAYRGNGLAKWLMECILSHPDLQGLRRILLATRDAHGLYAQFGFHPLARTDRWMEIHDPAVYQR